jgi:F0F1-type ATP synthase assembly protein I
MHVDSSTSHKTEIRETIKGCSLKVELALIGVILVALIGWLIGAMWEHPPGPGGFQILGALIGAMVALAILILGEALKSR